MTIRQYRPTIMVADDNKGVRDMLCALLQEDGYHTVDAQDGKEAVERFKSFCPDIVLLDISMPLIDGIEVCRQIQDLQMGQHVPVLMITASENDKIIQQSFEAGASDYIVKPVKWSVLRHRLHSLVKTIRAEREERIASEALRERNSYLETLNRVSHSVTSTLDLDEILYEVARLSAQAIDATSAYVSIIDFEARTYTVKAEYLSPEAADQERVSDLGVTYSLNEELPELAEWLKNPEDDFVSHINDPNTGFEEKSHMKQFGAKSTLAVPLLAGGKTFGYIELWESRRKRDFTDNETKLVRSIANQVALIIRNASLHHELRLYTEELEVRNRELDAYGHTIAHDLRNPLASIRLYAQLITKRLSKQSLEPVNRYLEDIKVLVAQMTDMMNQLLYLATLSNASEAVVPVNVTEVARLAVARFEKQLTEHRITIRIDSELPVGLGHEAWIKEVFANLVGNGIKYMGKDNPDPRIIITGSNQGKQVRYEVQDTGIGIAQEEQAYLFEMFTRGRNAEARGLGLGLAIVHRLVTRMNGQVGFDSVLGEGSTFWFTLPTSVKETDNTV